jgi:hypothetical protein
MELADAAGYSIIASSSASEREERFLEFMRTNPKAQRVWDKIQVLTPDEVDEMLSMNEAWISARKGRRGRS